jgi:hypothetical protein
MKRRQTYYKAEQHKLTTPHELQAMVEERYSSHSQNFTFATDKVCVKLSLDPASSKSMAFFIEIWHLNPKHFGPPHKAVTLWSTTCSGLKGTMKP